MFTLLSTTFRFVRPCIWPPVTRSFSCFNHLSQVPIRNAEEEALHQQVLEKRRTYRRERYATDSEFRWRTVESNRNYNRRADVRARNKAFKRYQYERNREERVKDSARQYEEKLSARRAATLAVLVLEGRAGNYTWKTHTPVRHPDRVTHYCTSCNQTRFLAVWWKEKSASSGGSVQADSDRYICNRCFANDWPRVVPEISTKRKMLDIFRSPELPLSKAQREERAKEEDNKGDSSEK